MIGIQDCVNWFEVREKKRFADEGSGCRCLLDEETASLKVELSKWRG
jgi:hypothetical protein